jgi:hypothetical protein
MISILNLDLKIVQRLHSRKTIHSQNLMLGFSREIQDPERGKTYMYLGTEESEGIYQQMKKRLQKGYTRRLRMIMKSGLNAKNKITAIGALAVPVLRCTFGIINWRSEEIRKIDRKTRRILTMYKMLHTRADTDRMYTKRKEGGRGVL